MNSSGIFFRSKTVGPRVQYTVSELFERRLGINPQLLTEAEPCPEGSICIHYGFPGGDVHFPSSGILDETGTRQFTCNPNWNADDSELRDTQGKLTSGDIPGLVFWLLSRYEEYQKDVVWDHHGRFSSLNNILIRKNLHQTPLIELWISKLAEKLKFLGIEINKPKPTKVLSLDLDNPTAFLQKGFVRNNMGTGIDLATLNFKNAWSRWMVLLGKKKDPFENMEHLTNVFESAAIRPDLFVWIGDYGPFDKGLNHQNKYFRTLVKTLSKSYGIGLHPSYGSFLNEEKIQMEKKRLESLIEFPVVKNRFHFLRFQVATSYKILEDLGFKEDFSMGFSEFSGFRAGTGNPFLWYDLNEERTSTLLIHPFCFMDSTAHFSLKISSEEFLNMVQKQFEVAKNLGFSVHTIFHNEHPAWNGWSNATEKYLK